VPFGLIECRASETTLRRRFAERQIRPDPFSDATWEIHVAQRREHHSFADVPAGNRFVLETDAGEEAVAESIDRILEELR
jgi:predicted kinase